jgi:hypothetical protein
MRLIRLRGARRVAFAAPVYNRGMKPSLLDELRKADEFFMGTSNLHQAAKRLSEALLGLQLPFAFVGGFAVNMHGHRRETEDINVLLTPQDLAAFKAQWLGRGWVERFPGSKGLRDAGCGVKVDVLLTGEFPGDGKPKPVAMPDPAAMTLERDAQGLPIIPLTTLLELKLASGMTAAHRLQDLADVIQLIRKNQLPRELAERLDPYVREKFLELWRSAQVDDDA